MFTNMILMGLRGIERVEMRDLGHINILCGKNNSGKSTILEGIAGAGGRRLGFKFSPSDVDEFVTAAQKTTTWGGVSGDPGLTNAFSVLCRTYFSQLVGTTYFEGEADEIWTELVQRYHQARIYRNWAYTPGAVANLIDHKFARPSDPVLVPPRRAVELEKSGGSVSPLTPAGSGVLDFLFRAKNQSLDSDLYKTYDRIRSEFKSITGNADFEIFLNPNLIQQLYFRVASGPWMPAASCGLGLQDVLVILVQTLGSDQEILLIEEPESHLHPEIQRRLLDLFSRTANKQFFIATHSNVFLDTSYVDKTFLVSNKSSIAVEEVTDRVLLLNELGYSASDFLLTDLVVLVEGPNDVPVYEGLFRLFGLLPRLNVKFWPLGGDIMDKIDLSILARAYRVFAIVDRDDGSRRVRKRFITKCAELGIEVTRLQRYAIENYYTLEALRAVFGSDVKIDKIDYQSSLEKQLGFNVKKSGRRLIARMSASDFEGTDLAAFIGRIAALGSAS